MMRQLETQMPGRRDACVLVLLLFMALGLGRLVSMLADLRGS